MRTQLRFPSIMTTTVVFLCAAALILSAQTDLSGYWAFRVKDGGVNYYQMQQNGETFGTVPPAAGRGGGRGGRGLVGTVKNGEVHLEAVTTMPGAAPAGAPCRSNTPTPSASTTAVTSRPKSASGWMT
jgi:hypothetical protein